MQFWLFILLTVYTSVAFSCLNFKRVTFLQNSHLAALILARGDSKGIKLKNIQTVGGQTLLGRALHQVKKANFDSVWVSTDHLLIAKEAEKYEVNIHWRDPETATDHASSLVAAQEFLSKHPEVDVIALVQCTSPFLNKYYLEQAKELIQKFDCVFSVTRSYKLLWEGSSGNLTPINFNPKKRSRRQEFQKQFYENGMFYLTSRKMIENGEFQTSG